MKIVVYSCVAGGYDDKRSDRIYINPCNRFNTNRMNAKLPKVLPHKFIQDADYTIWVDSSLVFKVPIVSLIEYFSYPKVGIFAHLRTTVNQEIEACKHYKLDAVERMEYHRDKPGQLASCSVIVRQNCEEVNRLNEEWWAEISAGSSRDQLSFPYTLGKIATYKPLPNKDWNNNSMWSKLPHKGKWQQPN